ncbi:MAG: hypothetical protein K0U33_05940 [Bacteroidetes bacterium]|nr:hypothetical protein [Crocinitomicaceae bacterium]MCH9822872.1 hypothetical protein [Bacteroidota bacterium]|tara:strand:+ start:269980 stop:270636 length:657 start_codon:yes stop_codon:yes gene_type:complete
MNKFENNYLPYFPIVGLALYVLVFAFAAADYPGGSFNYPNAIGYSFSHNFLCDVMHPITPGGITNHARLLAIISHLILSLTMISFFYVLPKIFPIKNRNTKLIAFFGVSTMTVFIFMYTDYHDEIVTITGILGTIALIPFFIELQNSNKKGLKKLVYLCYTLSIIVFFIFETKIGFYYLPFLQKITFGVDAWWVVWSCLIVINKNKTALAMAPQPAIK